MNIDDNKAPVYEEASNLVELLQNEYKVPPMFTFIELANFCLVNIQSAYKRRDKELPPELKAFVETVLPKIKQEHTDLINEQYLSLNTSGTA